MDMPDKPPTTVVVVDDTESSRYAVGRILRRGGYEVLEAATGAEALRLVAGRPDLVILDINLPDANGYDLCRRIKGDPATASVPVLHLSASFVESEDRSQGLEGGADAYLVYPLEPRELLATVEALLRIRRAEAETRAQRELLRVTLNSIGDAVLATDAAGVVTFINPVAQGLTGWQAAEAVGRPLRDVFHIVNEESGQPARNPVERVIATGQVAGLGNHAVLVARDGTRRPIDDTAAPIRNEQGAFVGVVLVFRDVSERRRLEGELQRRADDLAERDRRKDEFLAMLGHELRNPLAPIRTTLHVLRERLTGDPLLEQVGGMMYRQVRQMTRLVDDLLDVARISRGKIDLRKGPTDLAAAVNRAVEAVQPFLHERGHELKMEVPPGPLPLEADSARLEQVLANLLNNAAKYTPPGGRVTLTVGREGDEYVVRVRDTGIGIRPEMLTHVFDLFQQGERVPGRVSEGLGIGLTLVRRLVELHGGTVAVFSAGPDQGSEFVVRLPALPAGAAAAGPPAETAASAPPRPRRVLVVDDNVDAADSLALLLQTTGHEVRTAYDGRQALAAAREFRPQAVLLDVGLPKGMDGHEVARRLRQEPGLESVLLVAMTGYGQPEDVQRARDAGMDHHVTKPADPEEIQRLLAGAQVPAAP
jgi:PAS domain S-box-containing protein